MVGLLVLALLATIGCSVQLGVHVNHAPRCETRAVAMRWTDGTTSTMLLNVCRYGAIGRPPD